MDLSYRVVSSRKEVREGRSFNPGEFAIRARAGRRWSDGSTALLLDPLQLLERLAALVPAPRCPLLVCDGHGVLAPPVAWRAAIVSQPLAQDRQRRPILSHRGPESRATQDYPWRARRGHP